MAKIVYATSPPCCPAMTAGNEELKREMGDKYRKLDKYSEEDGPYRVIWMKAYKKFISDCSKEGYTRCSKRCKHKLSDFVQEEDPKYPEDMLKKACGAKKEEPRQPDKTTTLKVRVLDKETKQPIPGAQVRKGSIGREETTDFNGIAMFSPVKPGSFSVYAWKRNKSWDKKFILYPCDDIDVTISKGQTKTVDISLKREKQPMTLFVEVRDWEKRLVTRARVLLGAPPMPSSSGADVLTHGPYCIFPPGVDCRRPQTDRNGEAKIPRLSRRKYMLIAKHEYPFDVYRNPGVKMNLSVESPRKIVNLKESKSSWERVKLILKAPPKKAAFRLFVVSGTWAVRGLKDYVALLGVTVRIAIKHEQTGRIATYESDAAALLKIGISTPGVPWPADGGTLKGKDWKVFYTPTFEKGKLVNETSFAGKIGLKISSTTGLGTHLNIDFYKMPNPDSWFGHLRIIEIPIEMQGLPDLPSVGTSTTGTGGCTLTRV